MQKRGSKFFNIIITICILALIAVIGYVSYYYISRYIALKQAETAVDEFENNVIVVAIEDEPVQNEIENVIENPQETVKTDNGNATNRNNIRYKNYTTIGTIRIPKTKVKAPIVDQVTPTSISAAAAVLYGPGLNQVGNTVIVAHNYRNGTFFSNNKKLIVGDTIYITDSNGNKIEYSVTKTYITDEFDFSYATRDTEGKREISLSTCTTDPTKRLVIWAKEI